MSTEEGYKKNGYMCPPLPTLQCQLNCPYENCIFSDVLGMEDVEISRSIDNEAQDEKRKKKLESSRNWRRNNRERVAEYNKRYREANKEYFSSYQKAYMEKYKPIKRIKDREYYQRKKMKELLYVPN